MPLCSILRKLYSQYQTIDKQRTDQVWLKRFLNLDSIDWVILQNQCTIALEFVYEYTKMERGHFKPKSHTLVPIDHCSIADESINAAIKDSALVPFPAKTIEFRSNGTNVVANVSSLSR